MTKPIDDAQETNATKATNAGPDESMKAFLAWQATMARRAQEAAKNKTIKPEDWKSMKLDPSKLGVEMGPALTEEQFKEYCKNAGIRPQVIRKK